MTETRFTKDHEWARLEGDIATIGITDHAQSALGDVVFVELPEPGRHVDAAEACAVVESVKAASDVYAPLAGTVTELNAALAEDPAAVNKDAEAGAWFFKLRLDDPAAFGALLSADDYRAFVQSL
ncbi:glycine cleavage system protein GcvH [Acidiphilium sp.]|uniref:glycine cleavage system protein GcvH n=1 Tax=Acidiphilium sp. TaxID=527 RepID=UPI003D07BE2B